MRERIILQTNGAVDFRDRRAGTLEGWQANVARYAPGNSRLVLAISTAFAAPLLCPTGAESGGFHFRGGSSTGKSTGVVAAGSVWGGGGVAGYVRSWRATSNGLEGVCAAHNDSLLCLDEISQVSSMEASAIAYMLANGQGKTRATKMGAARRPAEWRLLFLSSGEVGLADKMSEDGRGRKANAGQEVRVVDIAADAGAGLGLFENLHGFDTADALARHLKAAAATDYGHPARAFVRTLVNSYDLIAPAAAAYQKAFRERYVPKGADGQVSRVAARFGLVGYAGEAAIAAGIVPWPQGEATAASARCFADWLQHRGGTRPAEETSAIATVRRFIEQHGASRFEGIGELAPTSGFGGTVEQRIVNRVGFKRRTTDGGVEYLILPESWKAEVCAGLDAGAVARTLADMGAITRTRDGKYQGVQRLPGLGVARCYLINPTLMAEPASEPPTRAYPSSVDEPRF